jgi:hypothetical protein
MEIKINSKWRVTSDARNYILHETKGKNEACYYFTSVGALAKSLINKRVRLNDNIRTLKQLQSKIDQYGDEIEATFNDYFK